MVLTRRIRSLSCVAFALSCLWARAGLSAPAPVPDAGAETEKKAPAFTDDLVILKSDLAIEGKVVRKTKDAVYVLVEYGVLTIPRVKVKSIELNLSSRLAELAAEDYVGRYRIASSALEEGNLSEARAVLEELVGKPDVPREVNKKLAGIYETQGEPAKALECWRNYLLSKPGDEEAKARIAELEKLLGTGGVPAQGAQGTQAGPAAPGVQEGMEVGAKWDVLPWGNAATLTVQTVEGNQVLSVEIPGTDTKDKTAIGRGVSLNLADKEKLAFRVFSAEKARIEVAVAIITAEDYYESRPVAVRPDWNVDLSIDLQSATFKCKKTDWRFEARAEKLDDTKQIIFLIYCGKRKALLYFDGIAAQ